MREAKDAYAICEEKLEDAKVQKLSVENFGVALKLSNVQMEATQTRLVFFPHEDYVIRTSLPDHLLLEQTWN